MRSCEEICVACGVLCKSSLKWEGSLHEILRVPWEDLYKSSFRRARTRARVFARSLEDFLMCQGSLRKSSVWDPVGGFARYPLRGPLRELSEEDLYLQEPYTRSCARTCALFFWILKRSLPRTLCDIASEELFFRAVKRTEATLYQIAEQEPYVRCWELLQEPLRRSFYFWVLSKACLKDPCDSYVSPFECSPRRKSWQHSVPELGTKLSYSWWGKGEKKPRKTKEDKERQGETQGEKQIHDGTGSLY